MGTFPRSPRTFRGAIAAVDPLSPLSRIVIFGYNPDSVTRTLTPRTPAAQGRQAADANRIWGAPIEKISLTVEIDAADQLETGDPIAATTGIAPQLSALEMLLYPSAAQVIVNSALLLAGTIEILPTEAPLTVMVLGPGRAVPIRVESLTITEQAFDTMLFPIQATAALTVQVLTYSDLSVTDPGYALFLVHQVLKETMASVAGVAGAAGALSGGVSGSASLSAGG
ncbi:hypothetical protein [Actinopolymorpha rutila]|uniref:Uncharacterized protein n=1 Tax=Actinopolymorpha rutila TaxID=446787 RepID=A0A852ZQK0_9ACTN|nr:hypothetical protein [Actinopolymorpha rutila]NYH90816.1 hypothetical protein [Actinopolymorpha rutila]